MPGVSSIKPGINARGKDVATKGIVFLFKLYRRCNISNTRKSVLSDIQTLRSGLKKRGAAEFF